MPLEPGAGAGLDADSFAKCYSNSFRAIAGSVRRSFPSLKYFEIEDITQDAWMIAWATRSEFRGDCQLWQWVRGIAKRRALKKMIRFAKYTDIHLAPDLCTCTQDMDSSILADQLMGKFDAHSAGVLRMYSHGYSYSEIAISLGLEPGKRGRGDNHVRNIIHRARNKIAAAATSPETDTRRPPSWELG